MLYALLQNLRSEISHKGLNSVELLFTLLRTLIPTLEHKTVLSFQVTHNKNQTGNRLRFLNTFYSIIFAFTNKCNTNSIG